MRICPWMNNFLNPLFIYDNKYVLWKFVLNVLFSNCHISKFCIFYYIYNYLMKWLKYVQYPGCVTVLLQMVYTLRLPIPCYVYVQIVSWFTHTTFPIFWLIAFVLIPHPECSLYLKEVVMWNVEQYFTIILEIVNFWISKYLLSFKYINVSCVTFMQQNYAAQYI